VIDNGCRFIYVDAVFAGSSHNVRCLRNTELYKNWRNHLRNDNMDVTQEYLLGDPGYMGWRCTYCDVRTDVSVQGTNPVVDAFDRRPSARTVQVEWGIGGLKNRFKSFISWCQSRRGLFAPMFEACCRLTNFINRSRMDFSIMDVGHNELHDGVYGDLFAWQWG
jgi:DDE superfamily endonuclease